MHGVKAFFVLFLGALFGAIVATSLSDVNAQRTDLPHRVESSEQGPIATWWMFATPTDTVGRVQVNIPALCRAAGYK